MGGIARREKAERSLRDTETLLKLAPMLTSEKLADVRIAIVLLSGLASDAAVDARVTGQVITLINETLTAGVQAGFDRAGTGAGGGHSLVLPDQPRVEAIQRADAQRACRRCRSAKCGGQGDRQRRPSGQGLHSDRPAIRPSAG